jgi:DNA polymerase-3 subunit epsilon
MLPFKLTRPLCSIDIESTGLSLTQDRILTLGIVKHIPIAEDDEPLVAKYEFAFNPGIPIPEKITKLTGITEADVFDKPRFEARVDEILFLINGCDLIGYNLRRFDVPMLHEHIFRANREWNLDGIHIVDASNIFQMKEPRDLSAAVRKFCGRSHEGAHGALADAAATVDVLAGQLREYEDLGMLNLAELAEFSTREEKYLDLAQKIKIGDDGRPAYAFGERTRDVAVEDDPGFARWMLDRADFPHSTREVVSRLLQEISEKQNQNFALR